MHLIQKAVFWAYCFLVWYGPVCNETPCLLDDVSRTLIPRKKEKMWSPDTEECERRTSRDLSIPCSLSPSRVSFKTGASGFPFLTGRRKGVVLRGPVKFGLFFFFFVLIFDLTAKVSSSRSLPPRVLVGSCLFVGLTAVCRLLLQSL